MVGKSRALSSVLALGLCACAGTQKRPASVVPIPSAPQVRVATGLEDASETVRIYQHDSVDPENAMPTIGGYVRVHAPIAVAYEMATRFGEYKDLNPDYIEQSTVVDREPSAHTADLYLKVPTIIGEYVWAVVRFRPVAAATGYAYRGDQVNGNLDDLRIFWRIVPDGPNDTIAQFEFLADPHLPIPRPWIIPEVREGVRIMLSRFRARTEASVPRHSRRFDDIDNQ